MKYVKEAMGGGMNVSDQQQIIDHITEKYGPVEPLSFQEILPVHHKVHVAVHVIRPNEKHPLLTLFTTGMSDQPMKVSRGENKYRYAELIMHLPGDWPIKPGEAMTKEWYWPVQQLRQVAYYPHFNDTSLGGRYTITAPSDPPAPLGPQTEETCLFLFADGPGPSPLELDDGKTVHFYAVTTLYTEEHEFEKQHGLVPLLQRLIEHGCLNIVGVPRPNVALE